MGIVDFFVIVFICCIAAALLTWALRTWAKETPPFVYYVVWGVAVLIILVTLARALGLYGINPQIPKLR